MEAALAQQQASEEEQRKVWEQLEVSCIFYLSLCHYVLQFPWVLLKHSSWKNNQRCSLSFMLVSLTSYTPQVSAFSNQC